MTPIDKALLVAAGTFLLLFSAHYALDHLTPTFKRHPPRAYSVGIAILGLGCGAWSLWCPDPLPTGITFAYYSLIVVVSGAGTWTAYTVHTWQQRAARTDTRRLRDTTKKGA